jgi:hypothetical protein
LVAAWYQGFLLGRAIVFADDASAAERQPKDGLVLALGVTMDDRGLDAGLIVFQDIQQVVAFPGTPRDQIDHQGNFKAGERECR